MKTNKILELPKIMEISKMMLNYVKNIPTNKQNV